jgi:hypothetical protein
METQYHWHEAYRDSAKNMYRSSYQDQIHHRDVHVKSDFPAGYGAHNPIFRHDIRFKNTELFRIRKLATTDVSRDSYPNFDANLTGVPGFCYNPRGAKTVPVLGQIPVYGLKAPWAITKPNGSLDYRKAPPMTSGMRRTASDFLGGMTFNEPRPDSVPAPPEPEVLAPSASMPELPAPKPAPAPAPAPEPASPAPAPKFVPNMSATLGNFKSKDSLESALMRSLSQSSTKGAYVLNAR